MKYIFSILFLLSALQNVKAQFSVQYDPKDQPNSIQYFKPNGNLFVGDCIPFYHDGTYYLYWLLDSAHHAALHGLGGHQWALSTSTDLVNWKHYPVVLGIDEDWEKSICTGSVFYYDKTFYAFYATRLVDKEGKVNEQLSYATSRDGIHFEKQKPNPFYTHAPGYSKRSFRDPKLIVDSTGTFHLFVSSSTDTADNVKAPTGALVHITSKDLKNWKVLDPLLYGQDDVPECPDYFNWNGWYYIIYGRGGSTFYLKSRQQYGPWEYPRYQALNEDWVNVVKTAAFKNGRRIAAGWIPNKRENKDNGQEIFGGNIVLREVIQEKDGTLSTRFLQEGLPKATKNIRLELKSDSMVHVANPDNFSVNGSRGFTSAKISGLPKNYRLSLEMRPSANIEKYGFQIRASSEDAGYELSLHPVNREVQLHASKIEAVDGLDRNVKIDIIVRGDIIDVSVNNRRCITNRLYQKQGDELWFFAKHGKASFSNIKLVEIGETSDK